MQGLLDAMNDPRVNEMKKKLLGKKGGATTPAAPQTNVPQATGSFYQAQDPANRLKLLQAMAMRSRNPGGMPPTGTPGA